MTKLRKYATAGIAALTLMGVTACGDGGSSTFISKESSAPESAAPSQDAEELSAAKFKDALDKAQNQEKGQSAHMEASVDISAGGQSMTMSMSGDYASGGDPADMVMDMSVEVAGQQMQMKVVDQSLYMKGPGMGGSAAKPWVQVDLDDPNNPFGSLYETANPQSFTDFFAGAQSLKDLGTETVDGVETTHYAVTVSTKKMLAGNKQFEGMDPDTMGLPKQIKINAWLNSDQLPVKIVVPFAGLGSFEAHFSEYGEPVQVQAPPAKLVSQYGTSTL